MSHHLIKNNFYHIYPKMLHSILEKQFFENLNIYRSNFFRNVSKFFCRYLLFVLITGQVNLNVKFNFVHKIFYSQSKFSISQKSNVWRTFSVFCFQFFLLWMLSKKCLHQIPAEQNSLRKPLYIDKIRCTLTGLHLQRGQNIFFKKHLSFRNQ